MFDLILIGFGLTGRFIFPQLVRTFPKILVIDPYPLQKLGNNAARESLLPFSPKNYRQSRSQVFGGWCESRTDLKFFSDQGLSLQEETLTTAFAGLDTKFLHPKITLHHFQGLSSSPVLEKPVTKITEENDHIVVTAGQETFRAKRVVSTLSPEALAPLLFPLETSQYAQLTCDENAVRSLLIISDKPPEAQSGAGFYGPFDLGNDQTCGVECLGAFDWNDLDISTREAFERQGTTGKSYRFAHFFWSGPFLKFTEGRRQWEYQNESASCVANMERFFKNFTDRIGSDGEKAFLVRDFEDDPGLFHQAALRGDKPLFDENGFVHGHPKIKVLGSPLLRRLRGVHPTLEILKTSYEAIARMV